MDVYDAFGIGRVRNADGPLAARFDPVGFGGQFGYYHDFQGRYLLGHRYYDSYTGRFVTRDPIGYKGGINLYGFVGNNPVNESDPEGFGPPGATLQHPPAPPTSSPINRQPMRVIRSGGGSGGRALLGRLLFRKLLIVQLMLDGPRLADDSMGPTWAAEKRKRDEKGRFVPDPNRTKSPSFDPKKARKAWVEKNKRPWPIDPLTGENFDVQHMKKRSQGGALYDPDNIFPIHKLKHDRYHAKLGPDPN